MTEELRINIGPRAGVLEKMVGAVFFTGAVYGPLFLNHMFLGGVILVDIAGLVLSIVLLAAAAQSFNKHKSRTFRTAEEAAIWVREWKP